MHQERGGERTSFCVCVEMEDTAVTGFEVFLLRVVDDDKIVRLEGIKMRKCIDSAT